MASSETACTSIGSGEALRNPVAEGAGAVSFPSERGKVARPLHCSHAYRTGSTLLLFMDMKMRAAGNVHDRIPSVKFAFCYHYNRPPMHRPWDEVTGFSRFAPMSDLLRSDSSLCLRVLFHSTDGNWSLRLGCGRAGSRSTDPWRKAGLSPPSSTWPARPMCPLASDKELRLSSSRAQTPVSVSFCIGT